MPNRVEELELTVSELESTIDGLTEELVETKERVRTLEELLQRELDGDLPAREEDISAVEDEGEDEGSTHAEVTHEAEPDEVREATAEATPADDENHKTDTDADTDTTDEDADDSEHDDIIVA